MVTDGGERVVVHRGQIAKPEYGPLMKGDRVVFSIEPGAPLRRATDVRLIESAATEATLGPTAGLGDG